MTDYKGLGLSQNNIISLVGQAQEARTIVESRRRQQCHQAYSLYPEVELSKDEMEEMMEKYAEKKELVGMDHLSNTLTYNILNGFPRILTGLYTHPHRLSDEICHLLAHHGRFNLDRFSLTFSSISPSTKMLCHLLESACLVDRPASVSKFLLDLHGARVKEVILVECLDRLDNNVFDPVLKKIIELTGESLTKLVVVDPYTSLHNIRILSLQPQISKSLSHLSLGSIDLGDVVAFRKAVSNLMGLEHLSVMGCFFEIVSKAGAHTGLVEMKQLQKLHTLILVDITINVKLSWGSFLDDTKPFRCYIPQVQQTIPLTRDNAFFKSLFQNPRLHTLHICNTTNLVEPYQVRELEKNLLLFTNNMNVCRLQELVLCPAIMKGFVSFDKDVFRLWYTISTLLRRFIIRGHQKCLHDSIQFCVNPRDTYYVARFTSILPRTIFCHLTMDVLNPVSRLIKTKIDSHWHHQELIVRCWHLVVDFMKTGNSKCVLECGPYFRLFMSLDALNIHLIGISNVVFLLNLTQDLTQQLLLHYVKIFIAHAIDKIVEEKISLEKEKLYPEPPEDPDLQPIDNYVPPAKRLTMVDEAETEIISNISNMGLEKWLNVFTMNKLSSRVINAMVKVTYIRLTWPSLASL